MKMLIKSRKRMILLLAAVLWVVAIPYLSNAQTYSHIYVDAVSGVNAATGRGAAAAPYKTITYALLISNKNNLPDPWHVHIRPGTYTADPAKPVTEREIFPIRLRSDMIFEGTTNANECIIDAAHLGRRTNIPILLGENASGVHIRNLTIKNMWMGIDGTDVKATNAQIVLIGEGQKPNTLKGCIVHQDEGGERGDRKSYLTHGLWTTIPLVLVENTFSNNNFGCVQARKGVVATNNTFKDNGGTSLWIGGDSTGDITGNVFGTPARGGLNVRILDGPLNGNISDNTFNGGGIHIGTVNRGKVTGAMKGDVTHNIFNHCRGIYLQPGGGFYVGTLNGNLTHNTFTNNVSSRGAPGPRGGAVAIDTLTGNLTHNTFTNNTANGGGGVYVDTFTGNLTHNTFTNNTGIVGGGFLVNYMKGDIAYNEFTKNTGGGAAVYEELTGNVTHNIFDSNSVKHHDTSGLLLGWRPQAVSEGIVEVSNNIFFNNKINENISDDSMNHFRGVTLTTRIPVRVINNLFMLTSDEPVKGEYKPHIWLSLPECRFHNNIFAGMHTAIYTDDIYDLPITHNIFYNIGQDIVSQAGSSLGNDLEFWELLLAENASNNLAVAPRLVDPIGTKDFHLQAGSPAIDAGTNAYAPDDDLDGAARPFGNAVDIGPYEYGAKKRQDDPPSDADDPSVTPDPPVAVYPAWDVNEDGTTDIADLVMVAAALGTGDLENPRLDVNGDGVVDIRDLILVATHLGETTEAAAPVIVELPKHFTPETLQQVLKRLRTQHDGSRVFQRAIASLERLLASLTPKETLLLANYPNPFNPETWIPYQLSKSADVTLHIYSVDGTLVRVLSLGHKVAGMYHGRSRAAYWDGKNASGEVVSSGVYFYTLTAGDFSATRKMLIRK